MSVRVRAGSLCFGMNRDQASALVRKTLHERFTEDRFTALVRALLKRLNEVQTPTEIALPASFASVVNHCRRVATYTDPQGDKLDVLIIALNRPPRRTEDRIALRNFAAHYLGTRANTALLAACVDPGEKSWRFSFITLDNVLESTFPDCAQLRPARSVSIYAGVAVPDQRIDKSLIARILSRGGPPKLGAIAAMFGGNGFAREFCEDCRELFTSQQDALAFLGELDAPLIANWDDMAESIAGPLARYPFTAYESEALEREIAVDPELLSKVFENLLPEHLRHASGTYYTPRVIVRYMCQQALVHYLSEHVSTISREGLALFLRISDRLIGMQMSSLHDPGLIALLQEKAAFLDELLARVTVYDPAIGCGAFAMGMLHEIVRARLALTPMLRCDEGSRSAAALKQHAIHHSIHGMDADRGAVELTRLRLWLSQAVDDPVDSVSLHGLGDHVRQGDSLADDRDQPRGFDIIITNPPYVRVQARVSQASPGGDYDLYLGFTALALRRLAPHGTAAFILPHKFFNARYGKALRRVLSSGKHVEHIVYFGDHQVFEGSTSYVCLLFLTRQPSTAFRYVKVEDLDRWYATQKGREARFPAEKLSESNWNLVIGRGAALHERLSAMPKKLHQITRRIFQGLKTSADKIYIVERIGRRGPHVRVLCHQDGREYLLESELLHPLIKGGDSKAYALQPTERLILFPYLTRADGTTALIADETLRRDHPRCWKYLVTHRETLRAREGGKLDHAGWYGYGRSQALDVMAQPKIFTPDLAPAAAFSFDAAGTCFFTGGAAGGYGILPAEGQSSPYLLGLLNSKVLDWCLQQSSTPMKGGWRSYEARYIRELPIPDATDTQRRLIEQLVESLLLRDTSRPKLIERWLNGLVYELFFPQSCHAAGLNFFQVAAHDVATLERCLDRLTTLEEVQIIEGTMGYSESDITPKMSPRSSRRTSRISRR